MDRYVTALEKDKAETAEYLLKSRNKTQQQLRLEELLKGLRLFPERIADIACGAGTLSLHLSEMYPRANFWLVDLSDDALELAHRTFPSGHTVHGSADHIPLPDDHFDLVFCWQSILGFDQPDVAVREMVRICKPGGHAFAASLFNTDCDVDLLIRAVDHTRESSKSGNSFPYNCYSARTVRTWTDAPCDFHDFQINIDLPQTGRGVGTYTIMSEKGRLQVSAGMLMNWKILEIRKPK